MFSSEFEWHATGGSGDCPLVEDRGVAGGQGLVRLVQDEQGSICAKHADHALVFCLFSVPAADHALVFCSFSVPAADLRCGTCVNVLLFGWRMGVCTLFVFCARGV